MSNLLEQNIKHTNGTTAQTVDTSGRTTVSIMNNDSTYRSDGGAVTQNLVQGIAKAWVHFTSVSTTAALDSFNISSLTDTDTGDTTINVNNDFSNNDYACVMYTNASSGTDTGSFGNNFLGGLLARATGSVAHTAYGSAPVDSGVNDVIFHGDLA